MPVAYIDIPTGVNDGAKKKIFTEMYEAIHQAWPIPDTRVLIREWPNEAVSQDGRIEDVPMRPICTLAVPPGLEPDAKHRLVRRHSYATWIGPTRALSSSSSSAGIRSSRIGNEPRVRPGTGS